MQKSTTFQSMVRRTHIDTIGICKTSYKFRTYIYTLRMDLRFVFKECSSILLKIMIEHVYKKYAVYEWVAYIEMVNLIL